jgi:hypothetical protein
LEQISQYQLEQRKRWAWMTPLNNKQWIEEMQKMDGTAMAHEAQTERKSQYFAKQ